jgi:hypothetical protein
MRSFSVAVINSLQVQESIPVSSLRGRLEIQHVSAQ